MTRPLEPPRAAGPERQPLGAAADEHGQPGGQPLRAERAGDAHLGACAGQEFGPAGGVDQHVAVLIVVAAPGAVIVAHEYGDLADEAVRHRQGGGGALRSATVRANRQRDPVTSPAAPWRRPLMANAAKKQSRALVVELTTY
jgi:hypothetical protein